MAGSGKSTFVWPDQNNLHLEEHYWRYGIQISASTLKRCLILAVLILFALSQAGTTLFVMTEVGFSHAFALLLAALVGLCMIMVYYQKLAHHAKRERFSSPEYYKAHRDLMKSIEVLPKYTTDRDQFKQVQLVWFVLRSRHIIESFRQNGLPRNDDGAEMLVKRWVRQEMLKTLGLINTVDEHPFYNKLCNDETLLAWLTSVVEIEHLLFGYRSQYKLSDEALQSLRATVTQLGWFYFDEAYKKTDKKIDSQPPKGLLNQLRQFLSEEEIVQVLDKIKFRENRLREAFPKEYSKQFLARFRYYRVTVDQKKNMSPNASLWPSRMGFWGGFFNMWLGNNLLGLYGSLAGVSTLLVFFPVVHLSFTLKVTIAVFGATSAAFATCIMTWPLLNKLMQYFSRWRMREEYRSLNQGTWLVKKRPWTLRLVLTLMLAGLITFVAIHFNVFATWHLTNRLSTLFAGAQIAGFLKQITWGVKAFFAISQAGCTLLIGGSLYFYSCYQQYAGQDGKRELRWISVIDKIVCCIQEKNWSKTILLVLIGVCSAMAAFAQTLIWFRGFGLWMQIAISCPIFMAFFATFCEAGLASLGAGNETKRPDQSVINAWVPSADAFPTDGVGLLNLHKGQSNTGDPTSSNQGGLGILGESLLDDGRDPRLQTPPPLGRSQSSKF